MRVLATGATGVLGRCLVPLLRADGHHVAAPGRHDLDLADARAVLSAVIGMEGVVHLATRIPPRERMGDAAAWAENDALRSRASRLLVDAALAAGSDVYVQPTVALIYPPGPVDETTPLGEVPDDLRSALVAEREAGRATAGGCRGVVLRLGRLYGPATGAGHRDPEAEATLHVADAGHALQAALSAPAGIYNVVDDGESVANRRFKEATGWRPASGGRQPRQ